jgi:hypothetical protein
MAVNSEMAEQNRFFASFELFCVLFCDISLYFDQAYFKEDFLLDSRWRPKIKTLRFGNIFYIQFYATSLYFDQQL